MSKRTEGKKLMPRLRFPEFRDAGPWEVKRLGDIAESLTSLSGKTSKDFGRGNALYVPYINVYENTFVDPDRLERVDIGLDEKQNAVRPGDILFTVSSETPDEAGMSSVVLDDISSCYVNSFCTIYRPIQSVQIDYVFVGYYLRSPIVRKHFLKTAQGAIRFNLNRKAFDRTPILLPSPREQQKIADCLSSLDEVIELQAKKLEALKAHKKGLMQQLFPREGETVPRLRFPEFRDAGPWEVKRLGEVGEIITGTTPSTKRAEYYANGVYPWVTPTDIGEEKDITETRTRLSKEGLAAGKFVPRNSLLVTCIASIGKNAILRVDGSCNQQINAITSLKSTSVDFLYYLIEGKVHLLLNAAGQGGMAILNKNEFSNLRFPFPVLEEQQKIADCLSSLDEVIALEAQRLDALKAHKKGLMQQLFPQEEV